VFCCKLPNLIQDWNVSSLSFIKSASEHTSAVNALKSLGNGVLVSGSTDSFLKFWNVLSFGSSFKSFDASSGNYITALEALNNGNLVSGASNGKLKWWSTTTYALINTAQVTSGSIVCLKKMQDGNLAIGDSQGNIYIYNSVTYALIKAITASTSSIDALEALPNNLFASGGADQNVRVWNTSGTVLNKFNPFSQSINALAYLPNGMLAVAGNGLNLQVWCLVVGLTQSLIFTLSVSGTYASNVNAILVYETKTLAASTDKGYVLFYNLTANYTNYAKLNNGDNQAITCLEQACKKTF
jgi:WD40 repeat protein